MFELMLDKDLRRVSINLNKREENNEFFRFETNEIDEPSWRMMDNVYFITGMVGWKTWIRDLITSIGNINIQKHIPAVPPAIHVLIRPEIFHLQMKIQISINNKTLSDRYLFSIDFLW